MTEPDRWRLERAEAEIERLRDQRDGALASASQYRKLYEELRADIRRLTGDDDDDWPDDD